MANDRDGVVVAPRTTRAMEIGIDSREDTGDPHVREQSPRRVAQSGSSALLAGDRLGHDL